MLRVEKNGDGAFGWRTCFRLGRISPQPVVSSVCAVVGTLAGCLLTAIFMQKGLSFLPVMRDWPFLQVSFRALGCAEAVANMASTRMAAENRTVTALRRLRR